MIEQPRLPLHAQPGPLNQALREGDADAIARALLANTTTDGDCMVWLRRVDREGYPLVQIRDEKGKRTVAAHRLMVEATQGAPGFRPVHHACANRRCLNPDHLQVVEPHENAAEMLERQHYLRRIAHLEAALAAVDPTHPALAG